MTLVIVEHESTFILHTSFDCIDDVHVVKFVSELVIAFDNVGFSEPVILSVTVGGKFAKLSSQISITVEPVWLAIIYHPVIVAENAHCTSIVVPVGIAWPLPSIIIFKIPVGLPDVPLDPELPDVPLDPELPDVPLDPELPDVPLEPLVLLVPEVPLDPVPDG